MLQRSVLRAETMWIYNPFIGQLVFVIMQPQALVADGLVNFGENTTGDISIDTGDRTVTESVMDSGNRLV